MNKNKTYYKDDFAVCIRLRTLEGKPEPVPVVNFTARISTPGSTRQVEISQHDGIAQGWTPGKSEDELIVRFDRHGLQPGVLTATFDFEIPDSEYGDGSQLIRRKYILGTLTTCPQDLPDHIEAEITIPWHLVHDTDVYMDIIDAVNVELDRALGPDVYDTAFDEVNKVIDNIMGMSPLEPEKPSTVTAKAAPAVTGVLQGGIMPLTADPGRVYNGRKGIRLVNATDEQLVVHVRRVKPGQKVSLDRAFPGGAFCGRTIEVDRNSQYDSATNSVYHNGSAEQSVYILLPYGEGNSPYLTTDTEGRVMFAPSGAYSYPVLDNNFRIGELVDAELDNKAHVTSDKDGNEIRIAAGWAYGYTEDGRRLEVQVRRRPNRNSHVRWRRIKNISHLKCGVIRARLMTRSGKRSEWAYFTFYTNDKSGNIIYKRI